MRHFETKTITSQIREMTRQTCDLCGAEAKKPDYLWSGGTYDVNETEVSVIIRQREGEAYPEGGSGTEYRIDMCPKCFKEKLVPWLRSQGAQVNEKDWDW
jgi:hypothetical protein